MGKHCHDEGCPGVYEDDHRCSHCGEPDRDYCQYVYLDIPADVSATSIQVKLDDEGVVVDAYDPSGTHAVASAVKLYNEMRLSLRHWDTDVASATELCEQWRNGNHKAVIDILETAHPCVTAMVFNTGLRDFAFQEVDLNSITNLLLDRKTNENE